MSHNKIKVGGQSPDRQGDLALGLDNLSDVSTSGASSGQLFTKAASGWGASAPPPIEFAAMEVGFFALATAVWTSGIPYLVNDYLTSVNGTGAWTQKYNYAQFNHANTATSPLTSSNFDMSYDVLGAGRWLCFMGVACVGGTSATWQLHNNSGAFSHKAKVYSSTSNAQNAMLTGIFTSTGNDIVRAVLVSKVGTVLLHNPQENLCTGVTIIKIG